MQLLKDRAAARAMSRSGQRTMIQHTDNNTLKFMPSPEEAIRVLLGPPSSSYMDSRQTFERSFADLRSHQLAVFAAMQQAFIQIIDDLNPTAIEQHAKSQKLSLLGANKGRHWDTFVERWNAKAGRSEHGLLDAFVSAFADHYDRESKPKR
jgi:type VI secretion system protein ImpI